MPYARPDVDVVKKDREITKKFAALRQPRVVKIRGGLVVRSTAHIASASKSTVRNQLVNDAIRIGTNIFFNRKTEVDTVLGMGRNPWICVVNTIASILQRIQKAVLMLPGNELSRGVVFHVSVKRDAQ